MIAPRALWSPRLRRWVDRVEFEAVEFGADAERVEPVDATRLEAAERIVARAFGPAPDVRWVPRRVQS